MCQNLVEIPLVEIYLLIDDVALSQIAFGFALDVGYPQTPITRALFDRAVQPADLKCETPVLLDAHVNLKPAIDDDSHSAFLRFGESNF